MLSMKALLLMAIFSFGSMASVEIPVNHCSPVVDSKVYRSGDFQSPYPRTVSFDCTYICHTAGKLIRLQGRSTVRVHSMDEDASMTACQGVLVKKVAWGYDFDRVQPFYAYDTKIKELKRFAFKAVSRQNDTEIEYLLHLKQNLDVVIKAYAQAGNPEFYEAALIMQKMASELPFVTSTLDRYTKTLIERGGLVVLETRAESLVLMNLNSLAHWRVPHHLF